jgi:hypothetical protein
MKMKGKKIVAGNGLAELAARHKSAPRSRVQTHSAAPSSRIGLKRGSPRLKTS